MAKTVFTNNVSKLFAPFGNAIFGADAAGGHRHDGVDEDGHCGKISIPNDISEYIGLTDIAMQVRSTDVNETLTFTAKFLKIGQLVYLYLPEVVGTGTTIPTLYIQMATGDFPAAIAPIINGIKVPCFAVNGSYPCPAYLQIDTGSQWSFSVALNSDLSKELTNGYFGGAGSAKGFPAQVLSWIANGY